MSLRKSIPDFRFMENSMNTTTCDAGHRSELNDRTAPPSMRSRPTYSSLSPDTAGAEHLLVIEADALQPGQASALSKSFTSVAEALRTVVSGSELPLPGANMQPDLAATLLAVKARLSGATMQQRVYAIGSEPFIWSIHTAAIDAGLDAKQIRLCHSGSLKRRVWCTHCHETTENVTTNIVACTGCGRHLLVRDHFSRRLGAFMGVQIDAEVPGDVPATEEVFL